MRWSWKRSRSFAIHDRNIVHELRMKAAWHRITFAVKTTLRSTIQPFMYVDLNCSFGYSQPDALSRRSNDAGLVNRVRTSLKSLSLVWIMYHTTMPSKTSRAKMAMKLMLWSFEKVSRIPCTFVSPMKTMSRTWKRKSLLRWRSTTRTWACWSF